MLLDRCLIVKQVISQEALTLNNKRNVSTVLQQLLSQCKFCLAPPWHCDYTFCPLFRIGFKAEHNSWGLWNKQEVLEKKRYQYFWQPNYLVTTWTPCNPSEGCKVRKVSKTTDKSTLRIPIFKIPSMQDWIVREAAVSTHKQINMPMWRTKSPSISLDFQKQVSHVHKRLSVPAASKTQTRTLIGSSELVQDRDGWVVFFSGKTQITRVTHLALRHRWGRVECAPNWQNYTATSHQTHRPSPR